MPDSGTFNEKQLATLKLSKADLDILVKRLRAGPVVEIGDLVSLNISATARKKIVELAEKGGLNFDPAPASSFKLALSFRPPLDAPPVAVELSYTTQAGDTRHEEFRLDEAAPESDLSQIHRENVDLTSSVDFRILDDDHRQLFSKTYQPDVLMRRLDGPTAYLDQEIDLRKLLLPVISRFRRSGRFMVFGRPDQRFDGYHLMVAAIESPTLPRVLDLLDSTAAASGARALPESPDTYAALSALALRPAGFEFDGAFNVDQPAAALHEPAGWAWVLVGPATFFGFQQDPDLTRPKKDIVIMLPALDLPQPGAPGGVPMDATEQALLSQPDIFSSDPGILCRPFDTPGRIVSERRFSTVLRTTDPDVGLKSTHRKTVSRDEPLPWEEDPTRFQATSVARGHILDIRVRYRSNGYSLGDVAHSMTLAPRQTRRVVKLDFQRRERASRDEAQQLSDEVSQTTLSSRDYQDAVESALNEWSQGGSKSSTSAAAGGLGLSLGPVVIGGGGGISTAQSSAWQSGGRDIAATEVQNLRDAIRQYGDSLRTHEATVLTEVTQDETVEGVSEIVRNINYCHSLSIVYYQILRHLRIDTEVAGVRECVFVPLKITPFDKDRLETHQKVLSRFIRDPDQRAALRYVEHAPAFAISEIPGTPRKDLPLTSLRGSIWINIGITRPVEGDVAGEVDEGVVREKSQSPRYKELVSLYQVFAAFLSKSPTQIVHELLDITETERDRYFQQHVASHVARAFVNRLRLKRDGNPGRALDSADFSIAGTYRYGASLQVDFQIRDLTGLTRTNTEKLILEAPAIDEIQLPARSFADVTHAVIELTTQRHERRITTRGRQRDDLLDPMDGSPTPEGALLSFPISSDEERNDREAVKAAYQALVKTLNQDLYYYHKAIWQQMDRDALYTLLDGFQVEDAFGTARSLASIVDRTPLGILGNTLVFRVSQGVALDENFRSPAALLAFYSDGSRQEPMRISLPTSGLYARAHMDSCNACERHLGTTDWVLDNPEPELSDLPASLFQSRRADPVSTQPTKLPETLINLQNAPAAPTPSGLGDALGAVSSANAFRDMAGLAGTQQNARAGLESAANLASGFGTMALQQSLARLQADANAAQEIAAVAAANQAAVDMGTSTAEAARQATETFMQRKAEGAGEEAARRIADRADEIIRSDGGGSQTIVTEHGVETVSKEPASPRSPDPSAPYSVVPIPGSPPRILFMNFATGRADLNAEHLEALELLAGELGLRIENVKSIEGHASPAGSAASNHALGLERGHALFDQLYRLAEGMGEPPNYSPSFVESTGELGSYRARFRAIDKIRNAPGAGHPNDPVEKAVLFTFEGSVNANLDCREINFLDTRIQVTDHLVIIGNTLVTANLEVSQRTDIQFTSLMQREHNEISEGNVTVRAEEHGIVVVNKDSPGASVHINIGQDGTFKDAAQKHTRWRIKLWAPTLDEGTVRSLWEIIEAAADLVAQVSNGDAPSGGDDSQSWIRSIWDSAVDKTRDGLIQTIMGRIPGAAISREILERIRFGNISLSAEFRAEASAGTRIEGTLSGTGIVAGTTGSSPNSVIVNNAPYLTDEALTASDWQDKGWLQTFSYASMGPQEILSSIPNALGLMLDMNPIFNLLDAGDITASAVNRISAAVQDLISGSNLIFRAFPADEGLKSSPADVGSIGAELQLIALSPGKISFRKAR